MPSSFAHLHVHTEYSILDGASRVGDLVAAAAADGQSALGITDHGNMYGVVDFYKACRAEGVKPIIGFEAYMAHEDRRSRPPRHGRVDDSGGSTAEGQKIYYHLTLLAENNTGYKNLIQLSSRAFLEGYYYKPRLDWELLADHSDGLIATTGCLGGHVLQSLLREDYKGARAKAARLQEIFGKDNLFVEIQDHGIADQIRTNPDLIRIAKEIDAPLLATNDSHYTHRGDAEAHDCLLCVQTGSLVTDAKRFKFDGNDHYLKTAAEMRKVFADVEPACDNTLLVAERANVEIEFGKPQLPDFPIPDAYEGSDAYLRDLTLQGAKQRWGDELTEEMSDRLVYELQVISDMGFSSYFLIIWDIIRYAREKGIRVGPGRGSAAGCAVAYCLWITDLDPIRYDLLFERFLNPSRVSMPDIDMDFDSRCREEIIRYASQKYGEDHVAQIITFSTIKARAAVRDSARVLALPYALGDKLAKAMPPLVLGRDTPLWACMDKSEDYADGYMAAADLRRMYEEDDDARKVIDMARGLEGLRRQDSIHAAAVVITKEPLTEYVPIQRKPSQGVKAEDAPIVTQYEMHAVEELGLLKMDFLGLRNLDVIEDALDLIEQSQNHRPDIDNLPLDDTATYELLSRGDTVGVFQLESPPMRSLIKSLKPNCFDDVAALVALYRPGPMAANMHIDYADRKNKRQPVTMFHEDATDILDDTYGLMIYQENVMRVAQRFAGYSLAEADNLRKACGKKDRALMAKERDTFVAGCAQSGYGAALGTDLFNIIEQFADYAFNKSHSYGYGLIAYQCAYLKAQYAAEYMAALLSSVKNKLDRAATYLAECRQMKLQVLAPDINKSESGFAVVEIADGKRAISFGLSAIRHVGETTAAMILQERSDSGPYTDFYDFCDRVDPQVLNKGVVEALIKGGCFDQLKHPRQGLLLSFEDIVQRGILRQKERSAGVMSLFEQGAEDSANTRIPISDEEFEKSRLLAIEKEMLGLYVSDHPLMGMEEYFLRKGCQRLDHLEGANEEISVRVGGVVSNLRKRWTRKGDLMASFDLEDLYGSIEVTVFPKSMAEHGDKLRDDRVVIVNGRLESRDQATKVICFGIEVVDSKAAVGMAPVTLRFGSKGLGEEGLEKLKDLIDEHPGNSEVFLLVGESQAVKLPAAYKLNASSSVVGVLREMFGDAVVAA